MIYRKNSVGMKFNMLTVTGVADLAGKVHVRCDCGTVKVSDLSTMVRGQAKSCGCLRGERHSMTKSKTYRSWTKMKSRCLDPSNDWFHCYGGRGISVCDRWRNSFSAFLKDMGECPDGMTLDRKSVDGNYDPQNCRWATPIQQSNNRRTNIFVSIDGQRMSLKEAHRKVGFPYWGCIQMVRSKGISHQEYIDRFQRNSLLSRQANPHPI
jgi:hypothetical protein